MVEIKPFPAVFYNYTKVGSPRKVVCPPYDVISVNQAKFYRKLSRYNMINLTLPEVRERQNQYKKGAFIFYDWLKRGILLQDDVPAIYFYRQEFRIDRIYNCGSNRCRRFIRAGFIACLKLSDTSDSIYGHEHTRIEPKEDRYKLLINVQANLEPIFVLFSDARHTFQDIFKRYTRRSRPIISFCDQEGITNTLWRLTEPLILKQLIGMIRRQSLFIADGHHRYEVSLNYKRLMRRRLGRNFSGEEDFNYIMTYFCPIQSTGLFVRSIHRLVRGISVFSTEKLQKYFYIQKTTRRGLFSLLNSGTENRRKAIIGVYANKNFYIFTLRASKLLTKIGKEYRGVDVYILNELILSRLLGLNSLEREKVVFSADIRDLISQADNDKSSLVFFVKPVKISDIICLAKIGKKMPSKTTYFYPKVPSGLTIYKFDKY